MGAEHAFSYGSIDTVEIAGVSSRNLARAEAIAQHSSAKAVTGAFALIDNPAIDAIDVCVPSINHREYVVAALRRGKHVFCETPFALRLEDADAMIEAARASKKVLLVGLLIRSIAAYEHVHQIAGSAELGKVLSVTTYRLGSYLRADAPDHKEHYSELSTELMTFDFDFVQWLLGRPARITAAAAGSVRGGPGEISALLEYDDGRSATVLASGIMPSGFPFSVGFRVLLERGAFEHSLVIDAGEFKATFVRCPERGSQERVSLPERNPYEQELRLFADCIVGKADPALLDPERAREVLALSIATQQSLREHRGIDLVRVLGRTRARDSRCA
jgi:UDP-N-acetylglucosamine 3-dehydrogenase